MTHITCRDFLKFSASTIASLAFSPYLPSLESFDDSEQVRVATSSVSVYSKPNDQSLIVRQHFRDELINIYTEVNAGAPAYNPIWYRVWGGYVHRGTFSFENRDLHNLPQLVSSGLIVYNCKFRSRLAVA